jgi:hypothetical protein
VRGVFRTDADVGVDAGVSRSADHLATLFERNVQECLWIPIPFAQSHVDQVHQMLCPRIEAHQKVVLRAADTQAMADS